MISREWKYLIVSFFISLGAFAQSNNQIITNGGQLICNTPSYNNPTCLVRDRDLNVNLPNSNPAFVPGQQNINDPNTINDPEVIYRSEQFENQTNQRNYQTYPSNIPERFEYSDPYQMRTDPYEPIYPDPYNVQSTGSMSVYDKN